MTPVDQPIQGILLAAGRSTRFGADKLLIPFSRGMSVAETCFANLAAVIPTLAVLRPDQIELEARLRRAGATIVHCHDADKGLSASLLAGIRASPHAAGWIVALADMPDIQPGTIACVMRAIHGGALAAAPVYRGQRGHPVGFASALYPRLQEVTGDQGGRAILASLGKALILVDCDDPGILMDIDRPEDISRP